MPLPPKTRFSPKYTVTGCSEPYALDDRIDLKWKWVKQFIVWFCCPNYLASLFVKGIDPRCFVAAQFDMMHANWMCHALTQGITTIKTFIKCKKVLLSKNLSQKTQGSSVVSLLWQNKNLSQMYLASTINILQKFSNFCCISHIFCF